MKNLVKVSIFALALGFFASCAESTETPAAETTPAATEATAAPVEATPADTTAMAATEATAAPVEATPAADTAAKH